MHALTLALALAAAPGPTPVVRAVVYPDRAQVIRRGSIACGARAVLRFEGLPPSADAASFRASTSAGTIQGLRVESLPQLAAYAKQVADLEDQRRTLEQQLAEFRDDRHRSEAEAESASAYDDVAASLVSHEMIEPSPDIAAWSSALNLTLDARVKASDAQVKVDARSRAVGLQLDAVRERLGELGQASARQTYTAEVLVACAPGSEAQIELSYLVGGASWEPSYEARAEEGQGAVELATFATVHQATGEPWTQARVILSTAVPRQSATPPELQPLKVYATERGDERKALVRLDEETRHAESSKKNMPPGESTQKGLKASDQGLSVQLAVPEPADVPGDGTATKLFVARTALPAQFSFRAAPKLAPFVYRVADVTNTAPFPLLPGTVDAYRANGFIGRTPLERVAVGEPFHLSFGIDESLKIKRTALKEIQRQTGLFGGNQRFTFAYRFELANYQGSARRIELAEHVPVSELDDVKVELEPQTTRGFDLRADDGIVTWKLDLAPGASQTVDLAFHVDVPSSYDTSGL